jgi:Tfp pilus assembly protein PilX
MNPKRHTPPRRPRRGLASVLAMLFLVLFATLAVGFAAATSMNAQISRNERALQQAESAADGGMQFIRYQLGAMTLPAGPQLTDGQLLAAVATALGNQMNGTANMSVNGSPRVVAITGSGAAQQVCIPSPTEWITLDQNVGTRFRAMIFASGPKLVVTVDGAGPISMNIKKAIQMQYQEAPKAGAILNYGVATQGTLATSGATTIQGLTDPTKGSVLSADMSSSTPISIGGQMVSGDASIVNPSGKIAVSGASVGGTTDPTKMQQHLHYGVPAPTFPTVDTSVFTAYATKPYDGSGTCNNCYIPANTNPSFAGGATINGVMWVKAPNTVTFKGNTTMTGIIVSDTGSGAPAFNASQNFLNFAGNVSATPINQMSTSNPAYNANLAKLTGSFMLAPNFAVSMTGNFGTIGGSMVVGQLSMSGSASGIVQGSVIGMQDVGMSLGGHASITISSTGTTNFPSGMSFGNDYTPLPDTYTEVTPW